MGCDILFINPEKETGILFQAYFYSLRQIMIVSLQLLKTIFLEKYADMRESWIMKTKPIQGVPHHTPPA